MRQTTSTVMMVRPVSFVFNPQTAASNLFQKDEALMAAEELQRKVLLEFDRFVRILRDNHVEVVVIEDTPDPPKPDAIFPNNWIMMQHTGEICLFPMEAKNRRAERRKDILEKLESDFNVVQIHDLSSPEKEGKYLEATGSMIFDHPNQIAYACISPRTDRELFINFCRRNDYTPIPFRANDENGSAIYHTNVMMCIGTEVAVICSESIADRDERQAVLEKLRETGHEVVEITFDQMNHFAGNMLQLKSKKGNNLLVMSTQALKALNPQQVEQLEKHVQIVHSPLNTIERIGGGSARCMMAEIFLEKSNA